MMFQLDPLSFIPDSLKTAIRDATVDFVSEQAKKFLSEEFAVKLKKLRSDASFNKSFEKGLQQAHKKFVNEYANLDEDLVAAIEADGNIFKNEQVQKALLEMIKNPGKYMGEEHETIAETFTNVLPGRRNRERVDKAIIFLLRCLAEELWNLPELQPIYNLQFQRMTAEAMRQQVELQRAQLQALTTGNEGVKQALLQLTDAIVEKKLLTDGKPGKAVRPKILHNLPNPIHTNFVGREKEIEAILAKLQPYPRSQVHLITIDGIGGIGKSTLALEIAYRCLLDENSNESERFEAIIWTSAKKAIWTPDGIKTRHQILQTLDDIYTAIAVTLGKDDLMRSKPEEQAELIRGALASTRCLLIVDNLETVDDETVISFLMELPAPSKAIITTRHRIDLAYPVRLLGIAEKDARSLVISECQASNIELTDEQITYLIKRTGGVPLAIVWSIAQIKAGYDIERVLNRLAERSNDIARFCFEGVLNNLRSKPALDLLLSLSTFATSASREELGIIANLEELDRDDGLVLLEKLSLINKSADRFSMLPLTRDYSYAVLSEDADHLRAIRQRQHNYYMRKLEQFSRERQSPDPTLKAERRSFRENEVENILSHIEWCRLVRETEDIPFLIRGLSAHLWAVGQWTAFQKYGLIALKIIQQSPNRNYEMEAYFLFRVGRIDLMQGNHDISETRILEAVQLYRELNNISRLAHAASYLGILYTNQKRYQEAEVILAEVLEQSRRLGDKKGIARIQNVMGQTYLGLGKYDLAEAAIQEAQNLYEGIGVSTGLAASYELLGRIKLLQDQPAESIVYFNKCYEVSKQINVTWYMAFARKWLAEAFLKLGDLESAETSLAECIGIFRDTGMKEKLAEAQQMLAKINDSLKQHRSES